MKMKKTFKLKLQILVDKLFNTFEVVIFVEVFEMSTNNHAQEPLRIVRPEQYYVYYLL